MLCTVALVPPCRADPRGVPAWGISACVGPVQGWGGGSGEQLEHGAGEWRVAGVQSWLCRLVAPSAHSSGAVHGGPPKRGAQGRFPDSCPPPPRDGSASLSLWHMPHLIQIIIKSPW